MGISTAIQTAIYGRLSTYAPLMSVVVGVYDAVPQAADSGASNAFPYVTIGEDSPVSFADDCEVGADASIVIHSWSRHSGRKEVKQIQGLIFDALSRYDITVQGFDAIALEWESDQSFMDADGKTRHGVSTYRILML